MNASQRLEAIEVKLAHLERSLQELGATVMQQQRTIDALTERHRSMLSQIEILESDTSGEDPFQKPPHY